MNPKRRREQKKLAAAPWKPMQRAVLAATGSHEATIGGETFTVWKNHLYTVMVRDAESQSENWPPIVHLSIRRNDRQPVSDWRDVQRIKNELVGEECEGLQLFPAESRLVDTSNQYHVYCLKQPGLRFPIGYHERAVTEVSSQGSVQRPWREGETPADALPRETVDARCDAMRATLR